MKTKLVSIICIMIALVMILSGCNGEMQIKEPKPTEAPIRLTENDPAKQNHSEFSSEPSVNENSSDTIQTENTSREAAGVPQRQIELEMYPDGNEYYIDSCTHDVDIDCHWDVVTINFREEQEYMTSHFTVSKIYQYDIESDTWSAIPDSRTQSVDYVLSENLRGECFQGRRSMSFGYLWYEITVKDIETSDGWFHISYNIIMAEKEYSGEAYFDYGEYSLHNVEGLFTISFHPDEGFRVSR